ncbi:phosphoglycolate phosphatase [Haladaptatus sp. R4]|uniref:HAD family hydrolase n=1 Tax=Haladaptatus sp. R4 TaxID=1679489 RepID=UPI0007B4C2FA|nr:HAD family hydrolase [Haladaptatus sp. R4]KZN26281.1 phosphoglycolate phosphatase [Haladaptatus sp. R4]
MTYDSVLFDVDGVLLDFHSDHPTVYRQAVEATFGAFDVSPSVDDLNAFIAGATMDEMRRACARHDIDFERFWPEREENASALQSGMMDRGERVLYDDSSVLFDLADHHDMGLVSSNQHATIEYMVERFDLAHLFEAVYGRDPTVEGFDRTKPETYYIEKAMNDLDVTDGLYVGDSACDVRAAHRAGLDSAFIRREHRNGYELPEEPTYEIESLTQLHDLPGVADSA